ncbi:Proline-specific permease [Exophiala xenobiotica]|nr:Proline-specific permease [Exophiala xenobiotica]KAK5396070.1 Proline-specific permease [Exophiala xenobiotica]KAK5424023.1 Proline-specific permease [Exophiala xenobiotica]KAK5462004.1 Proline-specific permease [Exophiala xenobiotica]KAK5479826.1 Proline-specific permease [Exophiala xenobiotica]
MAEKQVDSKEVGLGEAPTVEAGETLDAEEVKYGHTKRGLTSRHVQLMAIGGSIGTGLFVGIGGALSEGGPLSLLLAFIIYPFLFVIPTTLCVGELSTFLPMRRGIFEMANRYVDPAFGMAFGYAYFYSAAVLVCTEASAVVSVMGYWGIPVNGAVWVLMAMVIIIAINVFAVKYYGEAEFIFSILKVLLVVGLALLTFITMVGGNPKHDAYGFRNWKHGNAMHEYYTTGTTGRFLGFFIAVRYAAFSLGGPDMIALAAGEIENPRKTIPRMARLIWVRVAGFYLLGVLAVGIICNSRDPRLLSALSRGSTGSAASPFVIGIKNLGIKGLDSLVNFVILTSGWSCGNAYFYTSTRTLYQLSIDGQAPKFLRKCTKKGVPIYAVIVVALISCLTFMVARNSSSTVFSWFVGLSTCATLITYSMMMIVWVGFYKSLQAQGISRDTLPWKAPFMPYHAYIGIGTGITLILFLGFDYFVPWNTQGFITTYFGIPYVVVLFVVWKVIKRTKPAKWSEVNIYEGKDQIDRECEYWETVAANADVEKKQSAFKRTWGKMWDSAVV